MQIEMRNYQTCHNFYLKGENILDDPRQENFCSTISSYCCPNLRIFSFSIIATIIDIVMFIIMGSLDGFTKEENMTLQISKETLQNFGQLNPYSVKYQYEFFRVVVSTFLHKDLLALTLAVLAQLLVGSLCEHNGSSGIICLCYLISSIGGNLTSLLLSDASQSGNEFGIFGLLGTLFGFLVQITRNGEQQRQITLIILFYLLANLTLGFLVPEMRNFGHFGSIVIGLLCGTIFPARNREYPVGKVRMVSVGLLFLYFTSGIYIFYGFRNPLHE